MPTKLNPYLSFDGTTREAMEFYKTVFGGKVEFHTFKEYNAAQGPTENDKIMHSVLTAGEGIMFYAADTSKVMNLVPGTNFGMSLNGDNETELKGYFDKLCKGGKIIMPFKKEVWGDMFGMCEDKFGIRWLVNVMAPKAD